MKHLTGIRTAALRPDQLWRDSIAAGGKPYASGLAKAQGVAAASMELLTGPQPFDSALTFIKAHAETSSTSSTPQNSMDTLPLVASEAN